jgi:hypothetical protein
MSPPALVSQSQSHFLSKGVRLLGALRQTGEGEGVYGVFGLLMVGEAAL